MCGARGSNVAVVEYLAEAVESLNGEATDCTGATALHHAAVTGHPAVITALANIPRIVLDATDKASGNILRFQYSDFIASIFPTYAYVYVFCKKKK